MAIKENVFMERAVKHWLRAVVESPKLEEFIKWVNVALEDVAGPDNPAEFSQSQRSHGLTIPTGPSSLSRCPQ